VHSGGIYQAVQGSGQMKAQLRDFLNGNQDHLILLWKFQEHRAFDLGELGNVLVMLEQ